jgi:hypothetical protein
VAAIAGGGKFADGAFTAAFGYLFNEVGLACRTAYSGAVGSAAHCGLFIFDRNGDDLRDATIRAQFSLAGGDTKFNLDWGTIQADLEAFRSGSGYFKVDVPSGKTQEQFEADVEAAADGYSAPKYDPVWGPNSNSAVGYAIITAGGTFPQIFGWSQGAHQWDWWFPNQRPSNPGP